MIHMAGMERKFNSKGASLIRPLMFLGKDCPYWKDKMEMYIKSIHYQLWTIISKGDVTIKALKEVWKQKELDSMQLKNKTRYTLVCALSKNE